jgi:hypothetical protein
MHHTLFGRFRVWFRNWLSQSSSGNRRPPRRRRSARRRSTVLGLEWLESRIVPSTVNLTSSLNPSAYTQSVTFTAAVVYTTGDPIPTGTVAFKDGGTTLDTETLNSSAAASFRHLYPGRRQSPDDGGLFG